MRQEDDESKDILERKIEKERTRQRERGTGSGVERERGTAKRWGEGRGGKREGEMRGTGKGAEGTES